MSGAHRRPGRHGLLAMVAAACAAVGAVLGATLVPAPDRTPAAAEPPPPAVVEPVRIAAIYEMTIFDDDADRGQQRCDAWLNPYPPGAARCTVQPVTAAPDQARARAGGRNWDRQFGDDSPAGN